jgi:hypothetical protein
MRTDDDTLTTSQIETFRVGGEFHILRPERDTPSELIAAGNYNFIDTGLRELHLARNPWKRATIVLVSFNKRFPTREILRALRAEGTPAAPLEACLMLGGQHPLTQQGWSASWGPSVNQHRFTPWPSSIAAIRNTTQNYWAPKIVCLGEALPTCVADYPAAAALTFNCVFGKGRNLVAYPFDRVWNGEDFCVPCLAEAV